MSTSSYAKAGLAVGALAAVGIGAALLLRKWLSPAEHPAAAFAGTGAHPHAASHTRDAGPDHIRDEDGADWDALDQASDESFPSSDPPGSNDFRSPDPISYANGRTKH